jgi:hypothetical protein
MPEADTEVTPWLLPRLPCVSSAPLGFPVVPDVCSTARCWSSPAAAVSLNLLSFFWSLRIPNEEIISITPMTISQMPVTSVSVTSEPDGYASTMMPARIVMTLGADSTLSPTRRCRLPVRVSPPDRPEVLQPLA